MLTEMLPVNCFLNFQNCHWLECGVMASQNCSHWVTDSCSALTTDTGIWLLRSVRNILGVILTLKDCVCFQHIGESKPQRIKLVLMAKDGQTLFSSKVHPIKWSASVQPLTSSFLSRVKNIGCEKCAILCIRWLPIATLPYIVEKGASRIHSKLLRILIYLKGGCFCSHRKEHV